MEPGDETVHFGGNGGRRGGLEVDLGLVDGAGDDLHWFVAGAVVTGDQVRVTAHEHLVPTKEDLVREGLGEAAIEVDHQFGDSPFGGFGATSIGSETQLLTQRGLHAGAIENFAFDLGGGEGLGR